MYMYRKNNPNSNYEMRTQRVDLLNPVWRRVHIDYFMLAMVPVHTAYGTVHTHLYKYSNFPITCV